ncbi:hypothetical protein GW17_00061208, partial [Ensete ventricosum]
HIQTAAADSVVRHKSSGSSKSFARTLLSQPSKIMTSFRESVKSPSSRIQALRDRRNAGRMNRATSRTQMGLAGLRFLDKTSAGNDGWKAVDKRFDQFAVEGRLPKDNFGPCIAVAAGDVAPRDGQLGRRRSRRADKTLAEPCENDDTAEVQKPGHQILQHDLRFCSRELEEDMVMGYCVCMAKAAAETLKLNMALILIPVCRNTLTGLRSTRLSSIIPFDDNINFHKVSKAEVTIGTLVHTIAHVTCDFPRLIACPSSTFMRTLGPNFNYKQPTYASLVASAPGATGILMIVIMAFSFTLATHSFRRNVVKLPSPFHHLSGFNAFWYAHHLLAVVYVLLIVHSYFLFLTKEWYKKTVSPPLPSHFLRNHARTTYHGLICLE